MAHSYVPSPFPNRRPTSWVAPHHLPITPPVSYADAPPTVGPIPYRRPNLALDLSAPTSGIVTPPLSYGSSSSSSSSESISLPANDVPTAWRFAASPEQILRGREVDLHHQLALRDFEQKHLANRREEVSSHPRIVKAPADRKPGFVEGLVDTAEIAITSIWSTSKESGAAPTTDSVLPLRWFIKETLRRSRTSCSTLQLALFYLHRGRMRIRERVLRAEAAKQHFAHLAASSAYPSPPASPPHDTDMLMGEDAQLAAEVLASSRDPIVCGRRMFLAALVCASKFLQDRNYSSRAWSKISGLSVQEINANERALLNMLEYQLFVQPELFANWTGRLEKLANDHAAKHVGARGREDEPMSPVSPVSSPPRISIPRSNSEYTTAPELGSDMHATLPTPLLGEMRPPSSLPTPALEGGKRSSSDWGTRRPACDRLLSMHHARPMLNRSCKTDAQVAGWLAAQQHGQDGVV